MKVTKLTEAQPIVRLELTRAEVVALVGIHGGMSRSEAGERFSRSKRGEAASDRAVCHAADVSADLYLALSGLLDK